MAREVKINILGDSRDFSRAVGSAERDAGRLDGAFGRVAGGAGRMAGAVALGAAGVAVAGGAAAMSFIRAAEESQQVTRQTEAVLTSMGASAWTNAGQIEALSRSLSNLTGVDDEVIQSGQNVLLTFGNIQNRVGEGNDIFDRATTAALDMSVALGRDMSSAAQTIGIALNDPVAGLSRLTRAGVQFTEAQEDQIRAMVEGGDVAGAQAIMVAELERQFGGSAEAQATASQRLSTMWGNLQEDLGEKLLPIFERVVEWLGQKLPPAIATASQWFEQINGVVQRVVAYVQEHWPAIQETIQNALTRVQEFISTFVGYVQGAWATFGDDIIRVATGVWEIVQQVVESAMRVINGVINTVMGVIRGDWDQVWNGIKGIFTGIWDAITAVARGGLDILKGIIGGALNAISSTFSNVWNGILDFFRGVPSTISNIASGMFDGIKNAFRSAVNFIIRAWNGLEFTIPGFDPPGPGSFPGFTLGVPNIPELHGGTSRFVASGGASEGLALLQTGEEVRSRSGVASDRGMGGSRVVVVQIGDTEIGRFVLDGLDAQARQGNYAPMPA